VHEQVTRSIRFHQKVLHINGYLGLIGKPQPCREGLDAAVEQLKA
jgi:hypothetical protein